MSNYLTEPSGAAKNFPLGASLYEPRGQARKFPLGAAPLYEPRGLARKFPLGALTGSATLATGPLAVTVGTPTTAPKEEKIFGLSKPVAIGIGAVLVAGVLYFTLVK